MGAQVNTSDWLFYFHSLRHLSLFLGALNCPGSSGSWHRASLPVPRQRPGVRHTLRRRRGQSGKYMLDPTTPQGLVHVSDGSHVRHALVSTSV